MPGDELAETAASGNVPIAARAPGEAPRPGDTVGRYVIERVLGAGGMGVVFAAHDPDLDRRVALKLLHADALGAGPEARTRLLREARAMAKVSHPNVITVYEVGTAGGVDFVAMELVEGSNVADWLRSTRRPAPEILRVFRAAGRGLAAAHAMGLVHRDFKPANVLVGNGGKVVVTDFGLARAFDAPDAALAETEPVDGADAPGALDATQPPTPAAPAAKAAALDETIDAGGATPTPSKATTQTAGGKRGHRGDSADLSSTITRTGALLGTPAYMAPEQFKGATAGPRADQYAFAVALWEGLAGARPYRGATFDELKHAVEHGEAADAERIPRRLRAVLARGLARDPDRRWRDMDEMLDALDRAERGRRPLVWALAGLSVVGLIAGVILAMRDGGDPRTLAAAAAACPISDADLEEVWSPKIAGDLGAGFGGDPAWAAAREAIDRHAAAWREERKVTCAEPAAREYHGRIACLLGVRDELAAITQIVPSMPAEALRGASVAEVLTTPSSCRSGVRAARPPLPDDPKIVAELSAIQRDSALARIAARAGKGDDARALATSTVKRARELDDRVGLALALEGAATVEHVLGACDAAEPLYAEAATVAESGSANGLRAMAKMGQLECFMRRSSDIIKIRILAKEAEAAVKGAGGDRSLMAVLDMQLADIDHMNGDVDRAIDRIARARAVFTELRDARRLAVAARSEAALLSVRDREGDEQRAIALTREALRSLETAFGPDHKQTRMARRALAFTLLQREPAEARALYEMVAAVPDEDRVAPPRTERAHGRVLDADGRPAVGAQVFAGAFLLASDDGVPLPVAFGVDRPEVAVTDDQGRFDLVVPDESVVLAVSGDLRSHVAEAGRAELTLRLAPSMAAEGTVTLARPPAPPPGAENVLALAARTTKPGVGILGAGVGVRYQAFARVDFDDKWSVHGLPAALPLRVAAATVTPLGDRLIHTQPLPRPPAGEPARADLTFDLRGAVLDVIVRADRAATIPSAQVIVLTGRLSPLPRDGKSLSIAMGTAPRWSSGHTSAIDDANRTSAGAALYQPGDIHARLASIPAGPITACVVPLAGDYADAAFMRQLAGLPELDVRCIHTTVAPAPAVQALVLETPPMRRLPPAAPTPPTPPAPPPPPR